MSPLQSPYLGLVQMYASLIERSSPVTAAEIDRIRMERGARAAYHVATAFLHFQPSIDLTDRLPSPHWLLPFSDDDNELLEVIERVFELYQQDRMAKSA